MKAHERDIKQYFRRRAGRVREVILLRDKRTGRHKGCAYVEMANLADVPVALELSAEVPDFQRFPILVKSSEAEKNYGGTVAEGLQSKLGGTVTAGTRIVPGATGRPTVADAPVMPTTTPAAPRATTSVPIGPIGGKRKIAQKVYLGNIDRNITPAQLQYIFQCFGPLEHVQLQIDPSTGLSRGFCFLSYNDPKDANLAIQVMASQTLAGRQLKTGWANQQANNQSIEEVITAEVPPDANTRIQQVHVAMVQLAGTGLVVTPQMTIVGLNPNADATATAAPAAAAAATAAVSIPAAATNQVEAMAAAALDAAFGAAPAADASADAVAATPAAAASGPSSTAPAATSAPEPADPTKVGGSDSPTTSILVHNMFDKDEEDEEGWPDDIKEEFMEECGKHGKILSVLVMSNDPGGKIYATFAAVDGARACAESLAGRFFDKRQLRAEFVQAEDIPKSA